MGKGYWKARDLEGLAWQLGAVAVVPGNTGRAGHCATEKDLAVNCRQHLPVLRAKRRR